MKRTLVVLGALLGSLAFADGAHAQNYVRDGFGKCAHIPEETRKDGVQLRTWDCLNKSHIKWEKVPLLLNFDSTADEAGLQFFWLKNNMTGKCLAVHAGRKQQQDGARVIQWDCQSGKHFQWATYGTTAQLIHRESKKCLHSDSGSNYAPLTIRTCTQIQVPQGKQWTFNRQETQGLGLGPDNPATYLRNGFGNCLHVPYVSYNNGTQLTTWDCKNMNQILWIQEKGITVDRAYFWFKNRMTSKCMAVHAGQKQEGAQVIQWSCGGEPQGQNFHWTWMMGSQLVHRESGKCLQVASGARNSPATLTTCTQIQVPPNMKWSIG